MIVLRPGLSATRVAAKQATSLHLSLLELELLSRVFISPIYSELIE
jgi:hypothetical protein